MEMSRIRQLDIITMLAAPALFLTKICLSPLFRQTRRTLQLTTVIAAAASLWFSAGLAVAAEGGSSLYLLGQRGQGAGILPPVEGVFFFGTHLLLI